MKLQDVMDELERAEEYARSLPQSVEKTAVLAHLTGAQRALMDVSDEVLNSLDELSNALHSG